MGYQQTIRSLAGNVRLWLLADSLLGSEKGPLMTQSGHWNAVNSPTYGAYQ